MRELFIYNSVPQLGLKLKNLTGHDLNIFNDDEELIASIPKEHYCLRATSTKSLEGMLNGTIPIFNHNFELNIGVTKFHEMVKDCDGVIVSKITATLLQQTGYTGHVLIPGKGVTVRGVKGCTGLSFYSKGE